MAEHDDLDALGRADPVDPASLPSPRGLEGQALFERITMAETTTDPLTVPSPPTPPSRSRWAIAVVATAAVVAGAIIVIAAVGGDEGTDDEVVQAPPTSVDTTEPVPPAGATSQMCVEVYDLATLAGRQLAFDGTVTAVADDNVTFAVNEWFRGGTAEEVTLGGANGLGAFTSVGDSVGLEPGTRLLVAGDDGFAWSCGFTQPYDAGVAEEWERTLAG